MLSSRATNAEHVSQPIVAQTYKSEFDDLWPKVLGDRGQIFLNNFVAITPKTHFCWIVQCPQLLRVIALTYIIH